MNIRMSERTGTPYFRCLALDSVDEKRHPSEQKRNDRVKWEVYRGTCPENIEEQEKGIDTLRIREGWDSQ